LGRARPHMRAHSSRLGRARPHMRAHSSRLGRARPQMRAHSSRLGRAGPQMRAHSSRGSAQQHSGVSASSRRSSTAVSAPAWAGSPVHGGSAQVHASCGGEGVAAGLPGDGIWAQAHHVSRLSKQAHIGAKIAAGAGTAGSLGRVGALVPEVGACGVCVGETTARDGDCGAGMEINPTTAGRDAGRQAWGQQKRRAASSSCPVRRTWAWHSPLLYAFSTWGC
jgi:hypothetical protein